MKDVPVAASPCGKRSEREQQANHGNADELLPGNGRSAGSATQSKDQRRGERHAYQCAIGPKQRGIAEGEGEAERTCPPGPLPEAGHRPEGKGDHEERGSLRERDHRIRGGEGTEGRQPERGERSARLERGGRDAARKVRQEQAAEQLEDDLDAGRGKVVFHSEKPEAESQKERIAGQADEGWIYVSASTVEGIAAEQQYVPGQSAVDEGVTIDLKEVFERKEAQCQSGGQGQGGKQSGAERDAGFGSRPR